LRAVLKCPMTNHFNKASILTGLAEKMIDNEITCDHAVFIVLLQILSRTKSS
jgi:hypothetical protein